MPNDCQNKLTIKGKNLNKIKEFLKSEDSEFDFRKILPQPKEVIESENDSKGMIPLWYEWNTANWGTKWNAYEINLTQKQESLEYSFCSAWVPPIPVIKKLIELFPEYKFDFKYFEFGMMLAGIVNKNGETKIADNKVEKFGEKEFGFSYED